MSHTAVGLSILPLCQALERLKEQYTVAVRLNQLQREELGLIEQVGTCLIAIGDTSLTVCLHMLGDFCGAALPCCAMCAVCATTRFC